MRCILMTGMMCSILKAFETIPEGRFVVPCSLFSTSSSISLQGWDWCRKVDTVDEWQDVWLSYIKPLPFRTEERSFMFVLSFKISCKNYFLCLACKRSHPLPPSVPSLTCWADPTPPYHFGVSNGRARGWDTPQEMWWIPVVRNTGVGSQAVILPIIPAPLLMSQALPAHSNTFSQPHSGEDNSSFDFIKLSGNLLHSQT